MKNKVFHTLLTFILLTANAGLCEQTRRAVLHYVTGKFAFAMGGVLLSALIIFLALSIYKKFSSINQSFNKPETEILKTPKSTEEAIQLFIHKNKLT